MKPHRQPLTASRATSASFGMSGRSPGELRLSGITVSELRFGAANGQFRKESEAALEDLFDLFELEDLPCGAAKDFAEIKTILVSKESRSDPTTC